MWMKEKIHSDRKNDDILKDEREKYDGGDNNDDVNGYDDYQKQGWLQAGLAELAPILELTNCRIECRTPDVDTELDYIGGLQI